MENKFTPGPWENRKNKIFVPGSYNKIAIVCVQQNFDHQRWKAVEDIEAEANAKLIAAAPDMLGSLIECLEGVKELNGEYQGGWDAIIEKAESAIKKATI